MKQAAAGAIVNLGSISSFVARFFRHLQRDESGALQMTRNLAMDLAPSRFASIASALARF